VTSASSRATQPDVRTAEQQQLLQQQLDRTVEELACQAERMAQEGRTPEHAARYEQLLAEFRRLTRELRHPVVIVDED